MSNGQHRSVFLEKDAYKKRRLRDVARAIPVIGTVLLMLPLSWETGTSTAGGVIYIFGVWVLLIILTAFVSRKLRHDFNEKTDR